MIVSIAQFGEVPADRQVEFEAWFDWSNNELRAVDGLTGRRLVRAPDGRYVAVVEHASADTFAAMHATAVASHVQSRLGKILAEAPQTTRYDVVVDLAAAGSCCGGQADAGGRDRHHDAAALSLIEAPASGGCCQAVAIPENVNAIRALAGAVPSGADSIRLTDEVLGIRG